MVPNCPKPERPVREGTRKEAIECGLAAAAAKISTSPVSLELLIFEHSFSKYQSTETLVNLKHTRLQKSICAFFFSKLKLHIKDLVIVYQK